ncbi:MAG: hypothetical protein NWF03_00415 [Candidatus Bathyarchaeota archaeon]|nr:hypothetical protein [Candidatus Bathyarchaeota archaeon]
MKAVPIFVAFFLLFTLASLAVPIPMFPGNMVISMIEISTAEVIVYLEAITNGLTYGFVTWLVFFVVFKKLDKPLYQ